MSEHQEQVKLFNWARSLETRHPQLKWMFSIANGGHRHIGVAKKLKAEGVKKGVHDILLPVIRETYEGKMLPGLFIEMKFGKNGLTKEQREFKKAMDAEGYQTATCFTWEIARDVIIDYLGIETE
tara:strand:+ start:312 stop:686 length:375 start_codon:yes stop_codon:yes gene_type:complete